MLSADAVMQLAALCSDHKRAVELAARYLELSAEIDERQKKEARADIEQAIEEMLAAGTLVKDRAGRILLRNLFTRNFHKILRVFH